MERSEGGQRLVDIERGHAPARRAPHGRRPTARSSPSRRATGSRASSRGSRRDRRRRRRRGHRRPAPAGQPDDRRGRRRAGPQGRRRGGLRRQGDQRHRRDPVVEGVARDEAAVSPAVGRPRRWSWRPARARGVVGDAPRRRGAGVAAPTPRRRRRRRPLELTIYGAASLKGALEKAKAAYEAANPGTTLTISTDSSAALETQIEQGAPGRRLPVGRHDEPAEARRRGPRRRAPPSPSRATS